MNKEEFFVANAGAVLSPDSASEEVLACMIVMHNYRICVSPNTLIDDAGGETVLHPLTRRHASEVVARVLKNYGAPHCDAEHWYREYERLTPFEVASDISAEWIAEVEQMIDLIKQTEFVSELHED